MLYCRIKIVISWFFSTWKVNILVDTYFINLNVDIFIKIFSNYFRNLTCYLWFHACQKRVFIIYRLYNNPQNLDTVSMHILLLECKLISMEFRIKLFRQPPSSDTKWITFHLLILCSYRKWEIGEYICCDTISM